MEKKLTPEQEALGAGLTTLQRLTVLGIVAGKSQRQAYIDAGGNGASPEVIDAAASKLLSLGKVARFKEAMIATEMNAAILTREQALERLTLISSTEVTDILEFEAVEVKTVNKQGEEETKTETIWRMKDSPDIAKRAAAAIKSVTMTKNGPKIEMYDAAQAISQISKMQGWDAAQKVLHGGDPANPVVTAVLDAEAYKKARKDMLNGDDC